MNAPITSNIATTVVSGGAVWTISWVSSLVKFLIMSGVLLTGLILMFTLGNLNEIRKNFPRYRCNPLFMPFASNFGYDTKDNFNFCLSTIFDSKAAEIFAPIYQLLVGFVSLTKSIVDVALGIRKLFSNFLLGVNGFVQNVRDRIQQLLFNIRMSFMRMQHLMSRVYGTMYAVIWMGTSAITAGFNISDNSLVQFLFEFCFDPETPLALADGTYIPIKNAKLGMKLLPTLNNPNPEITSIFEFDGSRTSMVSIDGVCMSREHYVFSPGSAGTKWLPARAHPRAESSAPRPRLICLNVAGHEFIVGHSGLVVADYDEHSSQEVIHKTQELAERCLNGQPPTSASVENEYELGIDSAAEVCMQNGSWKPLSKIQLGDNVWNAGSVLGIVTESVNSVCIYNSVQISASQLVYDSIQHKWIRNHALAKQIQEPVHFKQLITSNGTTFRIRSPQTKCELFVRDYREIPDPEMESAYMDEFSSSEKLTTRLDLVVAS